MILQDDCYGHRYSRPRTSRANLSTIVERPERIHASILGLATAYVRLGGRHAEGDAAPHPKKHSSSLSSVPFKIHKTARRVSLRSPAATAIHGAKWMNELCAMCDAAESKLALSGKELTRPDTVDQVNGNAHVEKPKLHEGDLYLCSESLNALEGALGGVCEGVDAVFNDHGPNRAFVCIRPPGHHCSADLPSGFCWLNNVHVGIGHAVLTHGLTHAAIIDFDLHHGDGSQSITWAHNSRITSMPKNTPISKKTAIGYFSLHDINSYPCEMGDDEKVRNASLCIESAHGQSIWNVHLQPWKTEAEFWQLYSGKYSVVLTKARNFLRAHSDRLRQAPTHPKAKAAIFLSAGFDASEWESPGMQRHQVNVPTDFYARLTRDVVLIAEEEGLGVDGRVISVLEGGYSDRALTSGVLSHVSGLTVGTGSSTRPNSNNGLSQEMGRGFGTLKPNSGHAAGQADPTNVSTEAFDPEWWSLSSLEKFEKLANPPAPIAASKKQRDTRPTYISATESYTAKIVSPAQNRRSVSGAGPNGYLNGSAMARAPSSPPPGVDWATAAYALSKLLVPSDRETRSCRPEDLNAEASRARRDRYSTIGLPTETPVNELKTMHLRDRKAKPQKCLEEEVKPISRATRRQTIADVSLLAENDEPPVAPTSGITAGQPMKHQRRRSSVASTASSTTADRGSDFSLSSATDAQLRRDPLLLKKARAPANPRPEVPKAKAVKNSGPVRVPSGSSVGSTPPIQEAPTMFKKEATKAPLAENEDLKNKDVDQLASGLKKMSIKLKVPPKDEYDARHVKPKPAPKGRPAKPAVARTTKVASPTNSKVKPVRDVTPPSAGLSGPGLNQQLPQPAMISDFVQGMPVSAPISISATTESLLQPTAREPVQYPQASMTSPPEPPTPLDTPDPALTGGAAVTAPDQEESQVETSPPALPPIMQRVQPPEETRPLTPITAKRTKQELPVFTSTSPIAFGKPTNMKSNMDQMMYQNGYADLLSKPSAPPTFSETPAMAGVQEQKHSEPQQRSSKPATKPEVKIEPQPSSLWDVPDTPIARKP